MTEFRKYIFGCNCYNIYNTIGWCATEALKENGYERIFVRQPQGL